MKTLKSLHAGTQIRQKEIIQAALACFIEKGFTATSVADICSKAKASTGSVYHHFKSKSQLAAAVYLSGIRDYQEGMLAALKDQVAARDGIFALVAFHLKWVDGHRAWAQFLFHQRHAEFMGGTEEELHQLNARFAFGMAAWFQKHIKDGRLKALPRDIFISLLLGPAQEYARQYLAGYGVSDIDTAVRQIAQGVWAALGAD
jgi:AcrR family transcriptional regulator